MSDGPSHPHADDASHPNGVPLPGDELVRDARKQITREITIRAPPEAVWPHLVSLASSADAATRSVLRSEAPRLLVLGALYDYGAARYLPFDSPRPARYWHAAWSFVLSPIEAQRTRLHARSRVACGGDALRWCSVWLPPFTSLIEPEQLRSIARAAEGELPSWYSSLREAAGSALRALGANRRAG
jgi:hypothetical protein